MEDLTGKTYNKWKVKSYAGNSKWNCLCKCGTTGIVSAYDLKIGKSKSCKYCSNRNKSRPQSDLTGIPFGELICIEYIGDSTWKCKCSCGKEINVLTTRLISGETKSCGHLINTPRINISNMTFNSWRVLYYVEKSNWMCECSCGKTQLLNEYNLINNKTKSCGHDIVSVDITGQVFGDLKVIRNSGERKWECICKCGKTVYVNKQRLLSGSTKSCGCASVEQRYITCKKKYGVDKYNPNNKTRTQEQIDYVKNGNSLETVIVSMSKKKKPNIFELSKVLNLNTANVLKYIHKYKLEEIVDIGIANTSSYEQLIYEMFPSAIRGDRKILNGLELDLLYPDRKLAIEFNGNYWHSSEVIDKKYHQRKTIDCAKQGIQLIHIFEYEWNEEKQQEKIIRLLKNRLNPSNKVIYARNCEVLQIDANTSKKFMETYHLQNNASAEICIGIICNGEILGVMSFGRPRFNYKYDWELIRLAFRDGFIVLGGIEKLFKYFIRKYNPSNIISYCDISKFTGNSYIRLGFKVLNISQPNYVWVKGKLVLTRYQTQKHKLVSDGIGTKTMTETEIMKEAGFIKVYDSGNLVLEWERKKWEI